MKQPNRIKAALRDGRIATGYRLTFPSVHIVEILSPLDFDYVWFDGEHGPFGLERIENLCRAAELAGVTPIARVPNIHPSTILQYLDRGIQGIMGPHITTQSDAQQLVNACLFGPEGQRSFGGNRGCDYNYELDDKISYYRDCNENMLVIALLEDQGVMENIDEILTVSGIDCFSIGPNDFAQGLGYPGDPDRKEVLDAMDEVYTKVRNAGGRVLSDIMHGVWVKQMLIDSAKNFLKEHSSKKV